MSAKYFRNGKRLSKRDRHSQVWLIDGYVYKCAPKVLIDTEQWFLEALADSGYVPAPVRRLGVEVLSMPYIAGEAITDPVEFISHKSLVLDALRNAECRHGDLTEHSVIVNGNRPIMIDFSESRHICSPLPDKRPGGDAFWLANTMLTLIEASREI